MSPSDKVAVKGVGRAFPLKMLKPAVGAAKRR